MEDESETKKKGYKDRERRQRHICNSHELVAVVGLEDVLCSAALKAKSVFIWEYRPGYGGQSTARRHRYICVYLCMYMCVWVRGESSLPVSLQSRNKGIIMGGW